MIHGSVMHGPADALHAWSLEPFVLAGLTAVAVGYWNGTRSLRRRARRGEPLPPWRVRCFWAGFIALFVALVSPVDPIGEALFAGHMVQHLLLTMVAAPLLVLGDSGSVLLWSLPIRGRRAAGRVIRHPWLRRAWTWASQPAIAWTLHATALFVWHVPAPYELAVRNDSVHALEHASFVITALFFWWVVAAPHARSRLSFGPAIFYLFSAAMASAILGAVISMSNAPWYAAHVDTARLWGLTALEDQQLAGLIMWVPAGFVYLAAIVPMAWRVLCDSPVPLSRPADTTSTNL